MSLDILQHGRAKLSFISAVGAARGKISKQVFKDVENGIESRDQLAEDLDERSAQIKQVLRKTPTYADYLAIHKWHLETTTKAAFDAFAENEDALVAELSTPSEGDSELHINDALEHPEYWKYDFHATTGGYDGHEYMGFIHGELIHKWIVDAAYGGAIFAQRANAASLAPRKTYKRILDMGCGTGYYTLALDKTFPDAEIYGIDCSQRMLEFCQRHGNREGRAWKLYHGLNEDSGFPDNHFDLVTSYILLHELPEEAMRATFAEAYRILEPGGDVMMCDAPRFAAMDPIAVWQQDDNAVREIEPFWRETASLDLAEIAKDAGFVDVKSYGVGEGKYPWIVSGRKGNSHEQ